MTNLIPPSQSTVQRQVVLDTETTGMQKFGPHYEGHCIIEIGAVELVNRRPTGRTLHFYIKPDREVDPEAERIHGITDEFLQDKPPFTSIAQEFIDFIKGAELIIHNAPFDVGFMDYEFRKHHLGVQTADISVVTDTLAMARKMYPGKRNTLDALCNRFGIDNSNRTLHGALLDAELLAEVYLGMTGGQTSLFDQTEESYDTVEFTTVNQTQSTVEKNLKRLAPSAEELAAHEAMLALINKKSKGKCIWLTDDAEIIQNDH